MDQRTEKVNDNAQILKSRDNIDRLSCVKKRGLELALKIAWMHEYEDSRDYMKKSKERLIAVTSNSSDNIRTNRTTKTKKHKMGRK